MLDGKTIIVTGAGGALGATAVEEIEKAGGKTILFDRSFREAQSGDRPTYEIDLTDGAAVKAVIDRVGDFDGVFNIAGGFAMGNPAWDDSDDWDKMMALNVGTVRAMTNAVVPIFVKKGAGAIVNVGAYAALGGAAEKSAYATSKRVVMSLTETLADEVRSKGVNVNAVLPTVIDTKGNREAMPDADPSEWVDPRRLAQVMVFLASPSAKDIHGALLPVRGRS